MASTIHPWASICETPIGFSPLPITDLSNVYPVAAIMVGIDTKKENSSADARDIPAICPAAMVDIERDVPGNTPEKIWQKPIHTACPRLMFSIFQVWIRPPPDDGPAASDLAFIASTIHMTTPPISNDQPMMYRFSRCLPITLVSRNEGIAVTTKATVTNPRGCVRGVRSPRSPRGKVERNVAMRLRKYTGRQRMAPS